MHFTNLQIPADQLPMLEDISLHPLEKSYITVQRIVLYLNTTIILAIAVVFIYFFDELHRVYIILPAAIILTLITLLWWLSIHISYRFSGYALRQKDVIYRNGWLVRKTRIVPLHRIQHVSVQSGPIERKYKLASVSVFTAGSEHADFTIRGITQDTATQIKDWITGQLHGNDTGQ